MSQDHNWDILHRRGERTICLQEGNRFYFVLMFYYAMEGAVHGTTDYATCLPRNCSETELIDDILPKVYQNFFDYHSVWLPDGSHDPVKSITYSMTLKEFRNGVTVPEEQRVSLLLPAALTVFPALLCLLCWDWRRDLGPGLHGAFSLRRGMAELFSPSEGGDFCADLGRLRLGFVLSLITLHVTQGSKWREVEMLETKYFLFKAIRPLALVQDAFIQLSTYLCVWSYVKAEVVPVAGSQQGRSFLQRLRRGLWRSWLKYLRQLPVCLFWNWFYLVVLPNVVYNPYNHAFPWFGIRWYHATGKCMQRKWRYSFLLGDVGAVLFQDFDDDWRSGSGNPCVNLWNFQLEIQAFTLTTSILCLPHGAMLATAVGLLAFGFSASGPDMDVWWIHHARGVVLQVLFLRLCGLPRASVPAAAENLRWPGLLLVLVAVALHGALRGEWLSMLPESSFLEQFVSQHQMLLTGTWQAALALGIAMLCEGCRARKSSSGRWLAILSRLAFGINVAHPFVSLGLVQGRAGVPEQLVSDFLESFQADPCEGG
ncbi:unnamed protein product [Symbiodinium natans]|uniref:Uncharacterized protein n=1 Tax=Symbiodinium natans TaxID=878477 RepID=A0A812RE44_9DINO|nr:unnamed protein product [Symbiodinium natans]